MKYKIISILLLFCVLGITIFATKDVAADHETTEKRIHQHISDRQPEEGCTCDKSELCTHLPLVLINTAGREIPGKFIADKTGMTIGLTTAEDGSAMEKSQIRIMDDKRQNHHPSDEADLESDILIRYRGDSSRTFDKKNYLIRFVDERGKYIDRPVMGMHPHYEWALHGPFMDKTLIRNYLSYNIAGEFMEYSPDVRFCEVMENGEYKGVYLMTETISNGKNCRLDMEPPEKDLVKTSFLVQFVSPKKIKHHPEDEADFFTNYTYLSDFPGRIDYPRTGDLTPERKKYIEEAVSDFEKSIYSYDYDTDEYGYFNNVNIQSFVDYFVFNEFTLNYDAGNKSTFIYKNIRGKYAVAPWDYNNAYDNYIDSFLENQQFFMPNRQWFEMFVKDEFFVEKVTDRYRQLRGGVLSEDYLNAYIDDTVRFLGDAVDRNYEVWGYTFKETNELATLEPEERNPKSYEEAIKQLKDAIHKRGEWMDKHIDILQQYCHESKNKQYNH